MVLDEHDQSMYRRGMANERIRHTFKDLTKPLTYPAWREIVRMRAVGCSCPDIARRLSVRRQTVEHVLRHPDAVRHMATVQDALDAEFVRMSTYSPWVEMLADALDRPRRRRRTMGKPPPSMLDGGE